MASLNAAYDKELDSCEVETHGLKDLWKEMRSFLAGIGGQFVLKRNRREDSYWRRVLESAKQEAMEEGWKEGMKKGAIDSLIKYLEFKFNKPKTETLPLLDETSLEEISALTEFAYTCDSFDAFIQQAEETKRRQSS